MSERGSEGNDRDVGEAAEDAGATPPATTPAPAGGTLDRALELVAFLREHCAWDRDQTPETLVPHLVEESAEVVDAILGGDPSALEGELGDLLLNLAFQVVIGEETGRFSRESVTARLETKMRRRHPHLFGDGPKEEWETLKAREREEGEGVLDGLARGLDPLLAAHRIQEKVSGVGFDWADPEGALEKLAEETAEVREAIVEARRDVDGGGDALEEEMGDLLFSAVNVARLSGVNAFTALQRANRKFRRRFEALEALARERGVRIEGSSLEALDVLWDAVKGEEDGG